MVLMLMLLLERPEPEQAGLAGGDVLVEDDRHLIGVYFVLWVSVG